MRDARLEARRSAQGLVSTRQRVLFVTALLIFGIASMYTCVSLLAHVSPALFPGKNILNLPGFSPLQAIGVSQPSLTSVFNRRINVLVIGMDQRVGQPLTAANNSDVIMVASIDPVSKRMSLLSIPRDLWVEIHPQGAAAYHQRINTSWSVGLQEGGTLQSAAQQLQTDLVDDFGIHTDYWVLLNFHGVEQLINDIGGVTINVPPDLAVPPGYYSDDDIHAVLVQFPAGPQHLDGYHAVAFGRYRNTDSDLVRIKRQQLVLSAALQKVLSLGLLNNPIALWNDYNALVKTDIPEGKMPGYALLVKEANSNVAMYSLGDPANGAETVTNWVTPGGADVLLPNWQNVQYWINQAFPNPAYVDSHVEIQNAAGVLASTTEKSLGYYLEGKGLDNVDIGPSDPAQQATQVVVNGSTWQGLGTQIAQWLQLPASAVVVTSPVSGMPNVAIRIGISFKLPAG